jgi:two-component system response regulator WspF
MELVAIGSSTGGPKALATILSKLPSNLNAAIVIVQHVDGHFSSGFADWLNQQIPLPVRLAVPGDYLQKGTVLVAGTNDHLYLNPDLTLCYTKNPIDYPYRPSVNVFFNSLAQHWKKKGTGILLTGMGKDGAEGLNALRLQGWHTIAQNQESCIVYGMPKAAVELNAAVQVLSLENISIYIQKLLNK